MSANYSISFSTRLERVFRIGSVDDMSDSSEFDSSFVGEEKYNTFEKTVSGVCPKSFSDKSGYNTQIQTIRRDGTSTTVSIAIDITTLLIDYTWQFMDEVRVQSYENMRKLFTAMFKARSARIIDI